MTTINLQPCCGCGNHYMHVNLRCGYAYCPECKNVYNLAVVPEERCENCAHYTNDARRCDHPELDWDVECYDHWLNMNPDDSCSRFERRKDNA